MTLLGYFRFIADEYPALYIGLIGRLIPVEAKLKTENVHPSDLKLDGSMSLPEMISRFEARIKNPDYMPRTIEHDDRDDDDGDDE